MAAMDLVGKKQNYLPLGETDFNWNLLWDDKQELWCGVRTMKN